ncbi:MAG: hypothetical protein R3F46_01260 [bacterium]
MRSLQASTLLTSLWLAVLLAACAGNIAHVDSDPAIRRSLAMRTLEGTAYDSGEIYLERSQLGGRELLQVQARGLRGLRHLYLEIPLADPAEQLTNSELPELAELSPLSLSLTDNGNLQFGWTALADSYSGSGLLASFELAVPPDGQAPGRIASKVIPAVDDLARNARWNILSWNYANPGDYDQNGVVSIADLTPLGQNFLQSGPFDPGSALFMVDGDGNGEINLADISVIGQNFGNSVSGYELYASPDGNAYPDTASARLVASIGMDQAQGTATERRHFRLTDLDVRLADRYWVLPAGSASASGLTDPWEMQWHSQLLYSIPISGGYSTGGLALAKVGGIPCASWAGGENGADPYFARANDAVGADWQDPILVPQTGQPDSVSALLDLGGRPAVLLSSNTTDSTWLLKAGNADGTSWPESVLVMPATRSAGNVLEFNGGLHLLTGGLNIAYLSGSESPDPQSFLPEDPIASVYGWRGYSLGGQLALCFHSLGNQKLYYGLYDVAQGQVSMQSLVELDNGQELNWLVGSELYRGRPYVWMLKDNESRLVQMRNADGIGQVWNAPQDLSLPHEVNGSIRFFEAYGEMMCLKSGAGYQALYTLANDDAELEPGSWRELAMSFPQGNLIPYTRPVIIRGHPAILLLLEEPGSLDYYYARFY